MIKCIVIHENGIKNDALLRSFEESINNLFVMIGHDVIEKDGYVELVCYKDNKFKVTAKCVDIILQEKMQKIIDSYLDLDSFPRLN